MTAQRGFSQYRAPSAEAVIAALPTIARPLHTGADLDPLRARIGTARYVLLGEASHGTAEYYDWRRRISQQLITGQGFSFIAVEGDWPDCYRVNRYVKGYPDAGSSARAVLGAFERWPTWMWANWEVVALVEWLRDYNQGRPDAQKIGFYGLDVYSLWDSLRAVLDYLQRVDPSAVPVAQRAFQCFEPYGENVEAYAALTALVPQTCEDAVVQLLQELRRKAEEYPHDDEAHFSAEQNALVAVNAERYYRTMLRGGAASWNIRDRHMAETLERLMQFHGPQAKALVWAHNTHIGDARYTDMARAGMVNLGQLVRELHGTAEVALVGFGSHRGTVIAAEAWGAPMQRMPVPPAREGSFEDLMHRAGADNKLFIFDEERRGAGRPRLNDAEMEARGLLTPRGHRAIGVVYNPSLEYRGNYVPTVLPLRYDAFLYLDETAALHPLHMEAGVISEVPETYPTGV